MTGYAKTCAVLQIFDTHPQQQLLAALLPVDAVSHGASRTLLLGMSSCGPTLQQLPQPRVCAGHMAPATGTLGPPSRALGEPGSETSPFFPCLEETLLFPGPRGQGRSWPSSRPRVPFPPKPCTPLPPNSWQQGGTGYSGSVPRGSGWSLCPLLRALLLPVATSRTTSALGRAAGQLREPGGHVRFVPPALKGAETLRGALYRPSTQHSFKRVYVPSAS